MSTSTGNIFHRLTEYEQRSLQHDAGEVTRQQRLSNWDGVVFRLADRRLTCTIDQVDEILAFPPYTPLPGAKEWLLGLANVRGNLAPVVDLGWFLCGTRTPVTARTRLLLSRLQGRPIGLVVDEVFGQRHFHTDDTRPAGEHLQLTDLVEQEFAHGEETWGILQVNALFRKPEFLDGAA